MTDKLLLSQHFISQLKCPLAAWLKKRNFVQKQRFIIKLLQYNKSESKIAIIVSIPGSTINYIIECLDTTDSLFSKVRSGWSSKVKTGYIKAIL